MPPRVKRPDARYEVISVSLPRGLIERANQVIPKTRRSRVLAAVLTRFLDSLSERKLAEEYRAYYAQRPAGEVEAERRHVRLSWCRTTASIT